MDDGPELLTAEELERIWQALVDRGFEVEEGTAAVFGRTWLFRRPCLGPWYLRTWLWERQTEVILRLGRADERGEVGPEHRFASAAAVEGALDESMSELEGWARREAELRCPECGGWMRAREHEQGPAFECRDEEACAGRRLDDRAIRVYSR